MERKTKRVQGVWALLGAQRSPPVVSVRMDIAAAGRFPYQNSLVMKMDVSSFDYFNDRNVLTFTVYIKYVFIIVTVVL